jgi:hypothetical protein
MKGHMVAWLVEALCYKLEGHWFNSWWDHRIFSNLSNPSSHTMALGFTQPLTEMNTTGVFLEGKAQSAHKADNLTTICEPVV